MSKQEKLAVIFMLLAIIPIIWVGSIIYPYLDDHPDNPLSANPVVVFISKHGLWHSAGLLSFFVLWGVAYTCSATLFLLLEVASAFASAFKKGASFTLPITNPVPRNDSQTQVYIQRNGNQQGPYSLAEVKSRIQSGVICGSDFAWYEGARDWFLLDELSSVASTPLDAEQKSEPTFQETLKRTIFQPRYILLCLCIVVWLYQGYQINALNSQMAPYFSKLHGIDPSGQLGWAGLESFAQFCFGDHLGAVGSLIGGLAATSSARAELHQQLAPLLVEYQSAESWSAWAFWIGLITLCWIGIKFWRDKKEAQQPATQGLGAGFGE